MTDNDADKNRENDGDQNELCDICMGRLDYIKCKYCSNKICVACITKLESLEYHYKYFTYDCCVCKKNNSLKRWFNEKWKNQRHNRLTKYNQRFI